jgi:hypothetical protein
MARACAMIDASRDLIAPGKDGTVSICKAWILGTLFIAGLTGCGAATTPSASATPKAASTPVPTAASRSQFGVVFLTDVNAVDVAAQALYNQIDADAHAGIRPLQTAMERDTYPYESALTTFDNLLVSHTYPAQLQADVGLLVKANEKDVSDIAAIANYKLYQQWLMLFVQDDKKAAAADKVVDADLGLPSSV